MDFSSRKQNVRDSKECWSIAKGKTIQGKKKEKKKHLRCTSTAVKEVVPENIGFLKP